VRGAYILVPNAHYLSYVTVKISVYKVVEVCYNGLSNENCDNIQLVLIPLLRAGGITKLILLDTAIN